MIHSLSIGKCRRYMRTISVVSWPPKLNQSSKVAICYQLIVTWIQIFGSSGTNLYCYVREQRRYVKAIIEFYQVTAASPY